MSNYSDMSYIEEMDGLEFLELFSQLLSRLNDENEAKYTELMLHQWGYQLPFMAKPIHFGEYMKKMDNKTSKVSTSDYEETNEELTERMLSILHRNRQITEEGVVNG